LAALSIRVPPAPPPFSPVAGGVRLAVRLTPRAGRAKIDGLRDTPDGSVVAIAVTQPPEDGKANAALESLLAKALHLPKSAVRVTQGGKSRNKTVTIDGKPEDLMKQLTELLSGASHHG
jgi:uncharacterized protein (TIGR00251 family)